MDDTDDIDETDDDEFDRDLFPSAAHFDCYMRTCNLHAKTLLQSLENNAQTSAKPKSPVFALDTVQKDIINANIGFAQMLGTNAKILNAFFEFHLTHAKDGERAEQVLMMGLRAQGQLVRTLNTMIRYENFQNRETN